MNVAIIPARGNSKGIPGKNLQRIGKLSLVERAIVAAMDAEYVHEVIVSTESDEIAEVAKAAGATVHERPCDLAQDITTSEAVLFDVLKSRPDVNLFAFMQCTSPFTTGAIVDACMHKLEREQLDCVFTAHETHSGYWQEALQGWKCLTQDIGIARQPRQISFPVYRETGAVYAIRSETFMKSWPVTRFCGRIGLFPVEALDSIEIDVPFDLEIARIMCEGSATKTSTRSRGVKTA